MTVDTKFDNFKKLTTELVDKFKSIPKEDLHLFNDRLLESINMTDQMLKELDDMEQKS